jgi:hypothetical protein
MIFSIDKQDFPIASGVVTEYLFSVANGVATEIFLMQVQLQLIFLPLQVGW